MAPTPRHAVKCSGSSSRSHDRGGALGVSLAMTRALVVALALSFATTAAAQDATTAGAVTTPHPTLEHISIDWAIEGDDDEDGVVTVRFREQGSGTWRVGHPLFRVPAGSNEGFSWTNRHSGSLFGLTPGTTYEIELTLADPDGGDATETVTASTRPVPTIPDDATEIAVTPDTFSDALSGAGPGDVLVLGAGTYASFTVGNDGSEGAPIVVRGSDAADVIIDGEVRMDGRSDVWLMDLTVRGQIKFNNGTRIVVQGCRIETGGDGIVSFADGTSDGYFADNTIVGPTVWGESALGASGDNLGEGIAVTGPGNVIAHNRVEGFRDCVSLLEDSGANEQVSVDIIGNDLHQCADDAIEADFAMGNVRVLRNRSSSSFIAWSSQPGLGGPTWFVRNVVFGNVFQVFKPNRSSLGDVLYHNTVVKQGDAFGVYTGDEWGRATTRNNIFIGGPEATEVNGFSTGEGRILQVASLDTATSSFDYDGFGSELGRFDGRFGAVAFDGLGELRAMTTEANAVQVGVSTFAASFTFPSTLFPPVEAADLRLAEGSAAVDVGVALPNINDGFAGAAPDLGAYELGSALPPYGPRTGAPVCGNGAVETGEECDDGGTTSGDGCSADCRVETTPGEDGGVTEDGGSGGSDGGSDGDGGSRDDGGTSDGDGCGCSTSSAPSSAFTALLVFALLGRRRNPRGSQR
jgi:MYXO-CTERM domain-containing protein